MTADEYLYFTEESNRIRELNMSRVSEPPSPFFGHQALVLRVAKIWSDHVEPRTLGRVAIAPCDVVLDHDRGLILQPDVLFVSTARLSIIRDQVWGAPDLVAEVLSEGRPSVTMLVNGGDIAYRDLEISLDAGRRVIVVAGTGRVADEIGARPPATERARAAVRSPLVQVVPADAAAVLHALHRALVDE